MPPKAPRSNALLGWLAVPVVCGVLLMGLNSLKASGAAKDGREAPDFSVRTFEGETLELKEFKGLVLVLDFWTTWCPSCREEMPMLVRVANRYRAKGVRFVAMSQDDIGDQKEVLTEFFYHQPDLKPFVGLGTSTLGDSYGVDAYPTLFVIDAAGKIRARKTGALDEQTVVNALDDALSSN